MLTGISWRRKDKADFEQEMERSGQVSLRLPILRTYESFTFLRNRIGEDRRLMHTVSARRGAYSLFVDAECRVVRTTDPSGTYSGGYACAPAWARRYLDEVLTADELASLNHTKEG